MYGGCLLCPLYPLLLKQLKFGCLRFLLKSNNTKVQWKKKTLYNIHSRSSLDLVEWAAFRTIDWIIIFAYWSLVLTNPSESLSSFWVSITFLKVGSFFIADFHFIVDSLRVLFLALFCKQEKGRSRLSRGPHFLNLLSLGTHWSMRWAGSHGVSRLHQKCVT